jgi:hypothetical protein
MPGDAVALCCLVLEWNIFCAMSGAVDSGF